MSPIRVTVPVGSRPGDAVRKRIASGCENRGRATSSGTGSPSAKRSASSTRSTPTAWRTRSAIWPPGMRAATSTTDTPPSGEAISWGKAIPSRRPRAATERSATRSASASWSEWIEAGKTWIQPTPNPTPGGRSRSERVTTLASPSACDDDPVHLRALDEPLEDRLAPGRLGQRGVQVRLEIAGCLDPEDAALPPGVDGLEDGRKADRLQRGAPLGEVPNRRERRLWDPLLGERPAHRDLVGQTVRDVRADRRQPEPLGHGGDDGNRAIRRDRQRAVDASPPRDVLDRLDVREVDDLGHVGEGEPRSLCVAIDRDDAQAALTRLGDRAALVAPGADEEDARHGAMLDG